MIGSKRNIVHLGYNDVSFPLSRIAMRKLSLYPERFTEGLGTIDFMGSNRNKEDIVLICLVPLVSDWSIALSLDSSLSKDSVIPEFASLCMLLSEPASSLVRVGL